MEYAAILRAQEYDYYSPYYMAHTSDILQCGDSRANRPLHLDMAQKTEAGRACTSYEGVYNQAP